jgi:hypothetical protein
MRHAERLMPLCAECTVLPLKFTFVAIYALEVQIFPFHRDLRGTEDSFCISLEGICSVIVEDGQRDDAI